MNTKLGIVAMSLFTLFGSAAAFAQTTQPTQQPIDAACQAKRDTFKSKMLARYDVNGNGVLDPDERAKMKLDRQAKHQEKRAEILAKYDTNKNGVLDPDEKAVLRSDRAAKILAKLDTNNDGVLSVDEVKCTPLARRFAAIDTDKSGTLSKAELVVAGPLFRHHQRA